MPSPILITGAARSGTSMVAGIINLCGAFGGVMSGPNRNNARGMFENVQIRNKIIKPYLRTMGLDALGQYPLPDITNLSSCPNIGTKIKEIMENEGYNNKQKVFYKGAKMCLMWPVLHNAFPDAKWVIVRRNTVDIVNSCIKTNFMRAFSRDVFRKAVGANNEAEGWTWWVNQHEKRFAEMEKNGLNIKTIWPELMINGDYSQIFEVIDWLGLKWNDAAKSFIDPKLWRAREWSEGRNHG
ncbi:MAG: sulfotransferase [Methylococcaceae bacterium]